MRTRQSILLQFSLADFQSVLHQSMLVPLSLLCPCLFRSLAASSDQSVSFVSVSYASVCSVFVCVFGPICVHEAMSLLYPCSNHWLLLLTNLCCLCLCHMCLCLCLLCLFVSSDQSVSTNQCLCSACSNYWLLLLTITTCYQVWPNKALQYSDICINHHHLINHTNIRLEELRNDSEIYKKLEV